MRSSSIRDERGILHVPLALLTVVLLVAGLGIWALLHHWKNLTQTQLRLDRCTGETALELKSKLRKIGKANVRIKAERIAEAVAMVPLPEAAQAMKLVVIAEMAHQEEMRAEWIAKQAKWLLQKGCGAKGDFTLPLPSLKWEREPADELGPNALDLSELPRSFRIEARHSPRASAAEVYRGDKNDEPDDPTEWKARWIPPLGKLGTGLR